MGQDKILNTSNEWLDMHISGNDLSSTAIVFVHGFGSNKNENFDLFTDIAASLADNFRIIQFDFSGYGESEGRQEDVCMKKMTEDLRTIVAYAKKDHAQVFMVAHSMGTFVAASLRSLDVDRIVFTSPPNPDNESRIEHMQKRIVQNGGEVNEEGISIYRRTNGDVQKIGSQFWKDARAFDPIRETKFLMLTSLVLLCIPQHDEIVKDENRDRWKSYAGMEKDSILMSGDHNFSKPGDRTVLIAYIKGFFLEENTVFVAHPISGDVENNLKKVYDICRRLHSRNTTPLFPSVLWRNYLDTNDANDSELAKAATAAHLTRGVSSVIFCYSDVLSKGMKDEVMLARNCGIPIIGKTQVMIQALAEFLEI